MDSLSPNHSSRNPDESLCYLGNLCKRGHSWEGTQQSLRYRSDRGCVVCRAERSKTFASTPEGKASLQSAYSKWRQSPQGQSYIYEYTRNPDLAPVRAAKQLRYRQTVKGQTARKRAERTYARTEGRRVSWRRKDVKRKKLKSGNREFYSAAQLAERYSLFGNTCAYCGSQFRLTIDHFVSLNCHGADAIWNIVPACVACNSSKQDADAEIWYKSKAFYCEQRWQLILKSCKREGGDADAKSCNSE